MKTDEAPTFLYVYSAKWCGPCVAMKRAKTCEKLAEAKGLQFMYVDVESEDGEALSDEAKVTFLPTIALRREGKELARHEGAANFKTLEAWFEGVTKLPQKKKSL